MKESLNIKNYITGYDIPTIIDIPMNSKNIIIMCHGFGGSKENSISKLIAQMILNKNIGVVAFDFPLHGESKAKINEFTVENCVTDINVIRNFVKKNFPKKDISLLATSFGGYIAINSFLNGNVFYKYVILRSPAVNMKDVLRNSLLKDNFSEYQRNGIARMGRNGKMQVTYEFYRDLLKNDILKSNKELKQKMLIFHGTDDDTALISDTETFTKLNSNVAKLIKIPGENHKMKIENIEKIIGASIKCIKENEIKKESIEER